MTGMATKHLNDKHSIVSAKTVTTEQNRRAVKADVDGLSAFVAKHPGRFVQIQCAKLAAKHGVGYALFKSRDWNLIWESFAVSPDFPSFAKSESLVNFDVRKTIVELYTSIKH
eukprot:12382836-Ditylum_brightwellii.AAC.1